MAAVAVGLALALLTAVAPGWTGQAGGSALAAEGSSLVYGDAFAKGWSRVAWGATVNAANRGTVYAGTSSISFRADRGWARLNLHAGGAGFDTAGYTHLRFAARASRSGQRYHLQPYGVDGKATVADEVPLAAYGGDPRPDAWTVYTIPLADLGAADTVLRDVIIEEMAGKPQPALYIDQVEFAALGGRSTQTQPTATPTAAPSMPARPSGSYYVSPTGSDAADGRSAATAWRTFANVRAGQAPSGSAVLAQAGGVWSESVIVPHDDMYFGVYGRGPRPKIVAPDRQYAFFADWKPKTQLIGWELTSATRRPAEWGIVYVSEGDYVVRDVVVHGTDGQMFQTRGPRGLVEDSEFYDNSGSGPTTAVSVGGYEGAGVPPAADLTVFRNNYVHDTTYRALANWGSNVLIEGNRVERWSVPNLDGNATEAPAGIYVTSRYLGPGTVRNNTVTGTGTEMWPIWVDTGPEQRTVVEGNVSRNARRCMWTEKTSNVVFRGNRCEATWEAGIYVGTGETNAQHSLDTTVAENTFVGPTPTIGTWIRILPGSTATVTGNVYLP